MDRANISHLVEQEIAKISQAELIETIRKYVVTPRCENRPWNYGEPNQTFPCWIVMEDRNQNAAVAYCEEGFGPHDPWGLLFVDGPHLSMGMDSGWFSNLEDGVRASVLWTGENPSDYEVR